MAEQKIIRKTYEAVETKAAEGENRTLVVTISTKNPDRSGDVVLPEGMISDRYLRNPVVAAFHDYHQPAIARTVSLQVTDNSVIAKLEFLPKGIYPLADILYEQYKAGFMNAWSIGYIPKKRTDLDPTNPYTGGHQEDEWELLEYSAVLVPDNPEALTMLRSKGIDEKTLDHAQHIEKEVEASKLEKEIEKQPETKEITPPEGAEVKEGRVLSGSNRKKIGDAITQLKDAADALEALMQASIKEEPDAEPDGEKSAPQPTPIEDAPLRASLVIIDQVAGKALRLINERAKTDN